jgi:hypothetical protein
MAHLGALQSIGVLRKYARTSHITLNLQVILEQWHCQIEYVVRIVFFLQRKDPLIIGP